MDSCRSKKYFLNLNDLTKERNPWLELNSERAETAKCGGLGRRKGLRTPSQSPICNFCWLGGHSGITALASRASLTSALTRLTCGKSTTPTTEPGLPGPGLARLGMGGGKGSEWGKCSHHCATFFLHCTFVPLFSVCLSLFSVCALSFELIIHKHQLVF